MRASSSCRTVDILQQREIRAVAACVAELVAQVRVDVSEV